MLTFFTLVTIVVLIVLLKTFVVVHMRESLVIERLGKFRTVLQPGFHFLVPFFDRVAYRHEIREQVLDIPSQTCITNDNMQVEVDGLVYLKVIDPKKASYGIGDYRNASVNLAQTTMRSEVGKLSLSRIFSERDSLNDKIVKEIDKASDPWGIKVLRYEIKNISPSRHVLATLEKQMEAERAKRAEITLAMAKKESQIIISEGQRQESINISEGEKQKRINLALGKAKEIELLATATAEGSQMVADAVNKPGGREAIKMQLVEQYIDELDKVLGKAKVTVLPEGMAQVKAFFDGTEKLIHPVKSVGAQSGRE
ncbi:MAG: paraslipin [Bdellovibrionales bacterium]|nr:paraslipin [Bdellovibrionales bacterium]